MVDASKDPDYCNTYDDMSREKSSSSPDIDAVVEAERRYFMSRVDDIILRLIFHQVCVVKSYYVSFVTVPPVVASVRLPLGG